MLYFSGLDRPEAEALDAGEDLVGGLCPSEWLGIVSAMSSSPIFRGVPGLGSSSSPSRPCSAKRRRHLPIDHASKNEEYMIQQISRAGH
jgi:hypothetical protein